ncbi:hypothetical protein CV102_22530 [Natronococcus pandeyae]|uniref:Uncharacterized protein n=1 Tax=Natronococcus pandeyae TaxID=2055836 RepID=A0A8J8Q2A2_9EURY|nr:hypothetical protein [Natronococcus pandeyae]TYL36404.1 hypothetical protein CV102_22530 [Natronococcus pandeyae]
MRSQLEARLDRQQIGLGATSGIVYAGVALGIGGVVVGSPVPSIRPATALPVVFGLLFGPSGAVGTAVGAAISGLIGVGFEPLLFFEFLATLTLGIMSYALWGRYGRLSSGEPPAMGAPAQLLEFSVVGITAAAVNAAILAWGLELLGAFPFFVTVVRTMGSASVAILLFGPPLLYALYPIVQSRGLTYHGTAVRSAQPTDGDGVTTVIIVAVVGCWLLVGTVLSVGAHAFGAIPTESLAKHVTERVAHERSWLLLFGWAGQVALGTVALFLVLRYAATLGLGFASRHGDAAPRRPDPASDRDDREPD